jgi:hypothetical protein
MTWYPTRSEVAAAETRLAQSRYAARAGAQQLRSSARAQLGRPAFLLGAAVVGLLIGVLIVRRRAPRIARVLAGSTLALGRLGRALLISVGTRSLARVLLQRRGAQPAAAGAAPAPPRRMAPVQPQPQRHH